MNNTARKITNIQTSWGEISVFSTEVDGLTTEIRIERNGVTQSEFTVTVPYLPEVHPYSVKIWKYYEALHQSNFVPRCGLGLYGCYQDYGDDVIQKPCYIESDAEHMNACVDLADALHMYYPGLFVSGEYWPIVNLLSRHDCGENELGGDQPDDGSRDEDHKNRVELESFVKLMTYLPISNQSELIRLFISFQDAANISMPHYREVSQIAKVIDKAEAILSGLVYEKLGCVGDANYKDTHFSALSAQDRHYLSQTSGDTSLVSSWLAHFVDMYHEFLGFRYVFDIIKAGIIDVRGEWLPWFDAFCEQNQIPTEHIHHPFLDP